MCLQFLTPEGQLNPQLLDRTGAPNKYGIHCLEVRVVLRQSHYGILRKSSGHPVSSSSYRIYPQQEWTITSVSYCLIIRVYVVT